MGRGLAVDRLQLHDNALRMAPSGEQFRIVDMTEPGTESAAKLEQIVRSWWIGANLRTVPWDIVPEGHGGAGSTSGGAPTLEPLWKGSRNHGSVRGHPHHPRCAELSE